ncbi:MAG TPA: hypothetical protein VIE37_02410 [Methylomirabilota bacterium]|jgi:hypothetical protein
MKKLTLAFLVATLILAPGLAAAQTGGTQAPKPNPSDRPMGSPGSVQPGQPGGGSPSDPAASPPSGGGSLSQHTTKPACEKAGGKWTESTKVCMKK